VKGAFRFDVTDGVKPWPPLGFCQGEPRRARHVKKIFRCASGELASPEFRGESLTMCVPGMDTSLHSTPIIAKFTKKIFFFGS